MSEIIPLWVKQLGEFTEIWLKKISHSYAKSQLGVCEFAWNKPSIILAAGCEIGSKIIMDDIGQKIMSICLGGICLATINRKQPMLFCPSFLDVFGNWYTVVKSFYRIGPSKSRYDILGLLSKLILEIELKLYLWMDCSFHHKLVLEN